MNKLYRKNGMIGGVCEGIGEYANIDPSIIRVLWAVSILVYGTGLLLYILLWILIPEEI